MAEQDDFEDDLFADLYEDDSAKPAPAAPEVRPAPAVVNGSSAVKTEEPAAAPEPEATEAQELSEQPEQDDDEIDFNLGGGNDYSAPAQQERDAHGPGIKEDGKMFIGGLNWETTDQSLKDYFSQFGEVQECTVMRDGASGRSRGFGFLTFKDARTVNVVMVKEHYLDGKIIDPKRAIPRDEQERTSKIFVGGVSQEASEQDFKEYFMQFGRVVDATLMMDKDTGRPRGFGFVTFDSEAAVDACINIPLEILGKPIEVKKAQPRGNVREEEDNRGGGARNRFRKPEEQHDNYGNQPQAQNNQMAPGGMTPQVMAQYWQRMQQYMAMMQQQMAMGAGRGAAMNPAMMNPMMMQQMQAAQQQGAGGRSQSPQAGQNPAMGMNPAMMNPMMMQQMQQAMQAQQMQGMGGGMGGGNAGAGGAGSNAGYNAYEQQALEQQKYEQQGHRGGRQTSQTPAGQHYNAGGNYGGQNQPTSWEGMYDDVPQPIPAGGAGGYNKAGRGGSGTPSGPQPAPPAGAPTGPKNAGKPGANYRGGGRGGGRGGYHPYSR
ncbi:hypothetical protein V490_06083 [Pseudogymnoascus sp. VKM F-3557]|nr:hypothetical protein V490_06083 [Pseudogymnoascus sp. VKM F-3557]